VSDEEPMKDLQTIQLRLDITQVNQILAALGKCPYADVYTLVETIRQQAEPQLQEASEGAPEGIGANPDALSAADEKNHD